MSDNCPFNIANLIGEACDSKGDIVVLDVTFLLLLWGFNGDFDSIERVFEVKGEIRIL